jgi:Domain of unknown function (DUF4124)
MMLRSSWFAMLVLVLSGSATAADTVFRCEDNAGRITYSNAACPSGSRSVRKLDDAPPVSIPAGQEAARDAHEAGQIAQSRRSTKLDPMQESRQLDEQIAATRRECNDLARRVRYAKQDLDGASPSQRSTAELALRRTQDEYALYCPQQ